MHPLVSHGPADIQDPPCPNALAYRGPLRSMPQARGSSLLRPKPLHVAAPSSSELHPPPSSTDCHTTCRPGRPSDGASCVITDGPRPGPYMFTSSSRCIAGQPLSARISAGSDSGSGWLRRLRTRSCGSEACSSRWHARQQDPCMCARMNVVLFSLLF
eukprot:365263-Chlamydomonas_euryale.AAC.5